MSTFDGPLPKVIEGVKARISEQLREFQYLGGRRQVQGHPRIPGVHLVREPSERGDASQLHPQRDHIRVMMYDDRMEILSPDKLPNVVMLENSIMSCSTPSTKRET